MPEEILAIVIISIFAGTAMSMVRMILSYKERKSMSSTGSHAGSSLTTSELERMMKRAVEEATEPLVHKIDDLENELALRQSTPQLEAPRTDLLLEMDEETEDADAVRVAASRTRA
jgi:hypothetical protein